MSRIVEEESKGTELGRRVEGGQIGARKSDTWTPFQYIFK